MAMIFSIGAIRTTLRAKAAMDDAGFSSDDTLTFDTDYWSQTSLSIGPFLRSAEPSAGDAFAIHPGLPTGSGERAPAPGVALDGAILQYADLVQSAVVDTTGFSQESMLTNYIVDGSPFDGDPADANGQFDIVIRYSGDAAYASYFQAAATRWSQIITADIPDSIYSLDGTLVDDLLIDAEVILLDGPGSNGRNVLGQAGPDYVRLPSYLPIHGVMQFDSYDLSFMVSQGILDEVILHEMGHVLGIGTIWPYLGLRVGDASYYGFTGSNALAEYRALSGNAMATSVPVQPGSVSGSSGAHWSESVFQNELMTPSTGPGNTMPISRMTIASLADLGYAVNLAAADTYLFPGAANHAPVLTIPLANVSASANQTFSMASLFTATDADGDGIRYYFHDNGLAANSGHFVVNGSVIADGIDFSLTAAQLAQTTFVAGAKGTSDALYVQLSDAKDVSSLGVIHLSVPANRAPVLTIPSANVAASANQTFTMASLFTATDADGDALRYYFHDNGLAANSGHFVVNGSVIADGIDFSLTAAQLAQTTFVAGAKGTSDALYVQLSDANDVSSLGVIHLSVPANRAPALTISSANVAASANQTFTMASLFTATDADGDALRYYFHDNGLAANSGHFVVNGSVIADGIDFSLTAAQLAQTTFVAGAKGTSDALSVQLSDANDVSSLGVIHLSVPANRAPVLTIPSANVAASANQTFTMASLFTATDADGDALRYYFHDNGLAANSGHFVVNGSVIADGIDFSLTAAQLAQTTFVAGALGTSDALYVQLSDGQDISSLGVFNVNVGSSIVASTYASAIGNDSFVFLLDLGQKAPMDFTKGVLDHHTPRDGSPADHSSEIFGAGVIASLDDKSVGLPLDATVDPLALFGMHAAGHASEHFV